MNDIMQSRKFHENNGAKRQVLSSAMEKLRSWRWLLGAVVRASRGKILHRKYLRPRRKLSKKEDMLRFLRDCIILVIAVRFFHYFVLVIHPFIFAQSAKLLLSNHYSSIIIRVNCAWMIFCRSVHFFHIRSVWKFIVVWISFSSGYFSRYSYG